MLGLCSVVGIAVGEPEIVGCDETLGRRLGVSVGTPVGIELGVDVGALEVVGRDVGTSDGRVVGRSDGDGVGEKDGAGVVVGTLVVGYRDIVGTGVG